MFRNKPALGLKQKGNLVKLWFVVRLIRCALAELEAVGYKRHF